ncbi:apolipoprotein N-acyltransferase [Pseudosporangium ferrugineum]|uniref:Apolipoprotein N-acyltransferase n=1 Tax=Pseudosporangium ferrugineum TaxID=439699 RepID=A0A2T0SHJ4_9ACTN|nr:apolipoprotein N-acyltransferase [Pseudosporangium ferrugineum]PRY32888.1 apolipoprotein N-acyltransferase [Pseudosporangium ferrugineum]
MTVQPTPAPAGAAAPGPAGVRPLPRWVSVVLALISGAGLLLSFPPYGLWWLAPVCVALLAAATHRRRLRGGFGVGLIAGLVLFVPLLDWTRIAAGWLPWMLLSFAQAGYLALLGIAAAWLSPLTDRFRAAWPLLTGLLWVTQEALRDRAPFGGFPWGRLAFAQDDAPALRLAVAGGAPLVTFAVAAAGGALVALAWRSWRPRTWLPAAGFAVVLAALVAGPAFVPTARPAPATTTVAVVQGNVPRLGLDFNAQRAAVLLNHVRATERLAEDVRAGRKPQPQLVIWPENSSDIDPLRNQDAAQQIAAAASAIGVPILVGTVLRGDVPGEIRNAGILWMPVTGPDLDQVYVKRHPVPFAEYMPLRPIARLVSDKVDLVQNMVAGDHPGVVRTPAATVGDVICFEVAYDGIVRDTVTGGAQILAVQTNNATFNEAEARQQLAMVRLRAVEHGRDALMVSTVGVSAFAGTDGRVHGATGFNVDAVVLHDMHVGGPRTLATRLGHWPEVAAVALALLALAAAAPLRRRRRGGDDSAAERTTEER